VGGGRGGEVEVSQGDGDRVRERDVGSGGSGWYVVDDRVCMHMDRYFR
jgi:hypothetical protein